MLSVFLSHSHSDEAFTRRLSEALQAHGIHTWLDEAEIRVGTPSFKRSRLQSETALTLPSSCLLNRYSLSG